MTAAAMDAVFDDVAGWTADAVRRLGGHLSMQLIHATRQGRTA